jgi:hypothetical protein
MTIQSIIKRVQDYMMYSPRSVGYNTTAEQRYLMQNLLVGFSGGSLLDIGCGRCDLYDVAREMAALNNDIVAYNAIDHNPIMTALGEQKWGLDSINVGAFETANFIFENKISAENFKTDPMNCLIGRLNIANQNIHMYYKDLIVYAKELDKQSNNVYMQRPGKEETFPIEIKGRTFIIRKHEIGKLAQTINDALLVSLRGYELGLYL